MPDQPKNPLNFWQELKRRKVIRVITVFAATAFVILELTSIIVEPLRLPEWTLQMVIVLLVIGFIISVILSWIYDVTPEGIRKTEPVGKVREELREPPSRIRGWKIATYTSIVIIIAILAINILGGRSRGEDFSGLEKSIAVLHFDNLSTDKEQAWFSDAITDVIINQLSKINEFRVLGRTSTIKYKSGEKTIAEIGEELGVNYIIEGSVQRVEHHVRIIVQLIRVNNEDHIWSDMYDKQEKDFLSIQNEIALEVAHELNTVLSSREAVMIRSIPTENVEAYDLYLQGRYYWNQRSYEGVMKSIDYYKKAIELDSNYALAYSGLADAYHICGDWTYMDPDSAFRIAKIFAHKALMLDNKIAEAYAALAGLAKYLDNDAELADLFYRQSINLNPNYASANQWYALFLTGMGRFEEARGYMAKALELDPNSAIINYAAGLMYYHFEEYDTAFIQYEKVCSISPQFPDMPIAFLRYYLQTGQSGKAKEICDDWLADDPAFRLYHTNSGMKEITLEFYLEYLTEYISKSDRSRWYFVANFYIKLGEQDKALYALEMAVEEKSPDYLFMNVEPAFKEIRSDPRFIELLNKMGM